MKKRFKNFWHGIRFMLQYTKKLNPAVFVPTFFLVILEIAKTFSSILLPQYFIDDITNRSSIRQTMFHLAILIIAIFGIQIFRAAITPYILKAYNQGDANTALDYAFHYVKMEYKDQENDEIRNTQEKLRRNVTANGFVADDLSGFFINLFLVIGFSFIIWKINKRIYALNIFKVVLDIAQSLTTVIFLRYIVQYIIIDKNWTLTAIFVGALVVSLGITQILSSVIEPILRKDMDLLEKQILTQVGMTAIKMDYFEMEKPFAKDLLQLAQDPGKFVGVLENVIVSISTFVTIIGLAATILAVDKILIVPLLVAIVLILLSEKVKALNWTKWKNLVIPPLRRTNYVLGLLKNPIYGKEVRINAIQEWLYDRAEENCTEYLKTKKKYDLSCRKFSIFSILINFLLFSFLTSFVVYVIYKDIIQIDEAVLVITAAVSLSSISEQFSNAFSDLMKSGTFVTDFRTCVNLSLKKEAENQNKPFLSENKSRMEIVFDHVSFRYPGKEQYILQDFSLKIHAGEKIAIVGLNGSGKTTLVKLLCRFYIPDEGQILLNGRNIYEYNEEEYNSFISAVFQDYKLFSFSLKDNILLGKTENPEDINIALKKSGFSQRLKTLDNGLDTLYSKEFDKNGVELSGGESQKLAIARACYKDAPIIILDEPTASLDAVAEYEIYAGFEKLVENKTAIIISHRLSSTHFCDRIIVINNGTVFEDGTHQSLMAKESGIYKKMFTTQAAHYFSDPTTVAVVD